MENILTNEMAEKRDELLVDNKAIVEEIKNNWEAFAPVFEKLAQKSAKELMAIANAETDPIKKALCAMAIEEAQPEGAEFEKE